ncbi:hypothetical protein JQ604_08310 [Bradyrhizobium jicamae]|uniref:hypothetical protein n=1 Tax=Bradyrhizobium jicamae TaxID=280332 RepID=UPI001BAC1D44|nr:hypothetical protein [Bradyrhizobium jicamae]MBR0752184.1 hypothetical protein [Bradyrhizobium jicamae]
MFPNDVLSRSGRDRASGAKADSVDELSPDAVRSSRPSGALRDLDLVAPNSASECNDRTVLERTDILQSREKIARLLRLFSSPRKRFGLTPDELLVFLAIGYLCTSISNKAIQVTPVALIDLSKLLGMPKETVRRKAAKLVALDYVRCTPKGVLIKEVEVWSKMLDRALS